ncbi:hypothetical protein [Prosthecomicrobium pneumaticum]|uniref:BioF2-like acetyltransferase domain-containing protein n=1 Tax=Prosthecomicrobium pneumaticum TaxID=81895 RepID=A0A7W9FJ28_9HYPH|nr:hypothetical protein [Prosthecomicrobium pneumaticum]MBB5751136.1 hypothetical protein [Prosthecomicrobium pneumaticum]
MTGLDLRAARELAGPPPLPFDHPDYAAALTYLGTPVIAAGRPVVLRPIPGTDAVDAFGPFPYLTPPDDPQAFRRDLTALGAVSWTAVLRPGTEAAASAAFDPLPLKAHFAHRRGGAALVHSVRTARHIRRGRARWAIAIEPLAPCVDAADALHAALEARAPLSRVARVDRQHFAALATLPGVACVTARCDGAVGAFLAFAEAGEEIHFHLTAANDTALSGDAMYALFDFMIARFGASHDLHLGGTPAGANGAGVGRFKARFANASTPVLLARMVLDPAGYDGLVARCGGHSWFPSYRDPRDEHGAAAG